MKSFGLLFLVVAFALSLSGHGCSPQARNGEVPHPPAQASAPAPSPAPAPAPAIAPAPATPPPKPTPGPVLKPIYFSVNKSAIRPDAARTLKRNLEWFRQNQDTAVRIAGNCDPKATRKYNRALGLRRAEATKRYLVHLGVDPRLLETVSYGKDRPVCKTKDKACWANERRVDFEPMPEVAREFKSAG